MSYQIDHIGYLIDRCQLIGCKLILANLMATCWVESFFRDHPGYINLINPNNGDSCSDTPFIDLGNDKLHPGPLQHQYYADVIMKKIKTM